MKRNFYNNSLKAIAIGIAVTMGSTTAISGVINNTVVNVYAGVNSSTKPALSANKYIEVPLGESAFAMFEITADDSTNDGNTTSDGTVKLLEIKPVSQITESDLNGTAKTNAYKGLIGGTSSDLVKVTYNSDSNHVAFKMTEIVENSASESVTVDGVEFAKLAKNLTTVHPNSFKNYTFSNGLDLSTATSLTDYQKSLAGVTINGNLVLKNENNLADAEFTGTTINGNLDLTSHSGTINGNAFKGATITGDFVINGTQLSTLVDSGFDGSTFGNVSFTTGVTSVANAFKGATITKLTFPSGYTGIANSLKGATIGTLVLDTGYTGVANDFDGATIGTLDLSENTGSINLSRFNTANITNLTLPNNFTGVDSIFAGATIGTLKVPANYTGVANDFKGITSVETLDLSAVTDALASSTFTDTPIGTLKLNTNTTFAKNSFNSVSINTVQHNGKAILGSDTTGANIANLTFGDTTTIVADAFKNATIPAEITLDKVTNIGANAFDVANPESVTVNLPSYANEHLTNFDTNAFGTTKTFVINVPSTISQQEVEALKTKLNVNSNITVKNNNLPTITSGTISNDNPSQITLTFSENIKVANANNQPIATDFKVIVNGSPNVVTSVSSLTESPTGNTLTLTLTNPIEYGQTIKLHYTKSSYGILDAYGEELANIDEGSAIDITNNVNAAPSITSGSISNDNPSQITLTFSENIKVANSSNQPAPTDFTVIVNGSPNVVTSVSPLTDSATSNTLTLTLTNPVEQGQTIKLHYTKSSYAILDEQNAELADIAEGSAIDITNNVNAAPSITSGSISNDNPNQITLTFSENIKVANASNQPAPTDFTVIVNGSPNVVTEVSPLTASATGNTLILTLTNPVEQGQTIKLHYTKSSYAILDGSDVELANIDEGSAINITNNVNAAPSITSGSISNDNHNQITLTFSENIKVANSSNQPAPTDFTVIVNGSPNVVTEVSPLTDSATSNTLILTLLNPIEKGQDVKLHYTKSSYAILDEQNAELANIAEGSAIDITNNVVDLFAKIAGVGTYKFKELTDSTVALTNFDLPMTRSIEKSNTFVNGILNANGKLYTLTELGDGETPLTNVVTEALKGHTNNVTTVKANAFKNNVTITELNLPKVTTIGANAFNGASNLQKMDIGSQASGKVNIDPSALTDTNALKNVVTNQDTLQDLKDKLPSASVDVSSSNSSNSGSSSSGGGSSAVINNKPNDKPLEDKPSIEDNKQNEFNNNIENTSLTLDTIKLPKLEGDCKEFNDVTPNHWAKAHIDKLSTAGIIKGYNGMFNPNGKTKRADVTIMLVNLLGLTPEINDDFSDVSSNAYYAPYVGIASTVGIVKGYNGMFNPESIISRQDTMVMIAEILKSLDLNVNTDTSSLNEFNDSNKISSYANESVAILINSGIISGNNGKLNPTSPITRAEIATIISKLYDILAEAK